MPDPDWPAAARELAARFAERAARHDRDGSFPFENFEDLRAAGFFALTVAEDRGGAGASRRTFLAVQEELARGDGSTALAFMMHSKFFGAQRESLTYPERWYNELCRGAVQDGWLCNTVATEEGLGSPAGGGLPDTVAVQVEGGWEITGRKTFTTMAPLLHYFIVLGRIDNPAGSPDIAQFVLHRDDPGVRIEETWDALGMRSTGSHDFVMEACRVPADRLATRRPVNQADPRGAPGMAWFALGVAATTVGVAQAARDFAVAFARERTPNSQQTIKDYPGVRNRIGRIDLLLQRSRALIRDADDAWQMSHGSQRRASEGQMSAMNRVAAAKIDTLNNCIEAVDLAMRVVGGVSLLKKNPIERYYRDVRAGLHNPPIEDRALEMLARAALDEPPPPLKANE